MPYTPDEISNIHLLVQHTDLNNVLLAFELIKSRGIVAELVDDIFWIYNKLYWEEEHRTAKQVLQLFKTYWSQPALGHIDHPKNALLLKAPIETQATALGLDLSLLSQRLYQQFPNTREKFILRFIFKYGTEALQKEVLPLLKSREHTGRFLLDLGGLGLKEIPTLILREKHIQILKLWGNELEELPDFWDQFQFLEVLNIAENKLQTLPPSFISLQQLQRLYAQNNRFDIAPLFDQIKQLDKINYLAITTPKAQPNSYSIAEQELLKQMEALVNNEKIHASEKEQNLFLALVMNKKEALQALSLMDLFEALSDHNEGVQKRAKEKILNWNEIVFSGQIPSNASITILGFVSFATRNRITALEMQGIKFTTELSLNTTHVVLGDLPEVTEMITEKPFIFLTEEDLTREISFRY